MSESNPLLIRCRCCEGYGATATASYLVYERGCAFPHEDHDEVPCQYCNGTGRELIEDATTRTLEDLEFEDFVEVHP